MIVAGSLIVIAASAASAVTAFLAVAATVLLFAGYLAALVCVVLAMAALAWPRIEHRCATERVEDGPVEVGSGVAGVLEAGSVSSLGDVIEVDGIEVQR